MPPENSEHATLAAEVAALVRCPRAIEMSMFRSLIADVVNGRISRDLLMRWVALATKSSISPPPDVVMLMAFYTGWQCRDAQSPDTSLPVPGQN